MDLMIVTHRVDRIQDRADALMRRYIAQYYSKHAEQLDLKEKLTPISDSNLISSLEDGSISLQELVVQLREVYRSVRSSKKSLGAAGMLSMISKMPVEHPIGFNPRMIGWIAAQDVLGEDQLNFGVKNHYGMPKDIPHLPQKFWRLARAQGFKQEHDPRIVFEALARMELEPDKYDVGRKRRIRAHKGENRRSWRVSVFYSSALLGTLSSHTSVPVRTINRYLRIVGWEMPPEWTLV